MDNGFSSGLDGDSQERDGFGLTPEEEKSEEEEEKMETERKQNIQSGRRFNICQNVNCHEHLLTEQEIRTGFCQKHGGLISDKEFEEAEEEN